MDHVLDFTSLEQRVLKQQAFGLRYGKRSGILSQFQIDTAMTMLEMEYLKDACRGMESSILLVSYKGPHSVEERTEQLLGIKAAEAKRTVDSFIGLSMPEPAWRKSELTMRITKARSGYCSNLLGRQLTFDPNLLSLEGDARRYAVGLGQSL